MLTFISVTVLKAVVAMRLLKGRCEVSHVRKKITLGTAKEIRTEGREDSPWRTVRGTGRLSAS